MRRLFVYNFIVFYIAPPRCGFSQLLSDALSPNRRNSLRKRTSREINPTSQPLTGKSPCCRGPATGACYAEKRSEHFEIPRPRGYGKENAQRSRVSSLCLSEIRLGTPRRRKGGAKGHPKTGAPGFSCMRFLLFFKIFPIPADSKGRHIRPRINQIPVAGGSDFHIKSIKQLSCF